MELTNDVKYTLTAVLTLLHITDNLRGSWGHGNSKLRETVICFYVLARSPRRWSALDNALGALRARRRLRIFKTFSLADLWIIHRIVVCCCCGLNYIELYYRFCTSLSTLNFLLQLKLLIFRITRSLCDC